MSYVIYKEVDGVKEYYTGKGFTRNRLKAKEFNWLRLFELIVELIKLFNIKLKIKKI